MVPSADERTWIDLRLQVASRLRRVNSKHCHEAFDRLGKRNALGPHGVVLFYAAPVPSMPYGYRVLIATRLFLAGPESDDLPSLLHKLASTAKGNIARAAKSGRRWDPRGPDGTMVNGGDPDIPRDAKYVGVGVTTLDTDAGSWHSVATILRKQPRHLARRLSMFDLSGQGIVVLSDGTTLRMVRDPHRRFGQDEFTSNKSLDVTAGCWHHHSHTDLTGQGDQTLRAAWTNLMELHRILAGHLVAGRLA
ncbi:hypothetical protein ACVCAH_33275 [Micromonospora sp. LZ34]